MNFQRKPRSLVPLEKKFFKKVNFDGPIIYEDLGHCHIWTGRTNKNHYGVQVLGRRGQTKPHLAHRLAWEISYGEIPAGLWVLHKCDNPPCVRVSHLYLGTPQNNALDREERKRGRDSRGTASGVAKINEDQVKEIRTRYAVEKISLTLLGSQYGLKRSQIYNIVKGISWKHIV